MTNEILYIDDNVAEAKILKDRLKELGCTPSLSWLTTVLEGKALLESGLHDFDMVIVDVNGTALDFARDIGQLRHPKIVVTSGVFDMALKGFSFVLKDDLPDVISKFYKKIGPVSTGQKGT